MRKEKQHTKQLQPSQTQRKSNTTAMARKYILNILRELDRAMHWFSSDLMFSHVSNAMRNYYAWQLEFRTAT